MQDTPLITPAQFLSMHGIAPDDNDCEVALLAFCPFHEMKDKAHARALDKSLFVHVDAAHQFKGSVDGREFLMVDCVYGGPVASTVLEEMAYLGVRRVLGYGYAGSLRQSIPPGSIVVASAAVVSDGTSREYTSDPEVGASAGLLASCEKVARSLGQRAVSCKAWTTDAIYRELPSKVQSWLTAGADFVNMDTSHLYAVSRAVGIESVYAALIADYVGGEEWQEQFFNIDAARGGLQDMLLKLLAAI